MGKSYISFDSHYRFMELERINSKIKLIVPFFLIPLLGFIIQ